MSASIEIPGRNSSIHNSEADFVVISESPVVQLSEGDVLDGLEVKMDSFSVQSISLKDDIEKLTRENEQLKQTALSDGQAIKKHLQLCSEYKEQMTKCHERDAAMLEEARQATLKLRDENSALNAVLENVRGKLEEAVIKEYSLKTSNNKLENELQKVREELAVCQGAVEEARQRADEASYVQVEGGPFETESELKAEIAELRNKLASFEQQPENESVPKEVRERDEELSKRLTEALEKIKDLEEQLKIKDEKMKEDIAKLMEDHVDTVIQLSASKTDSDSQAKDSSAADAGELGRAALLETIEELRRLSSEQNTKMKTLEDNVYELNVERNGLHERLERVSEENRALNVEAKALESRVAEIIRDHLASFKCLQSEQASETEALKLALRSEQTLREKAETDYANLLETWQNFERNFQAPVDLGAEIANQQADVDRAAQNLAAADRLRLEADARSLRETIKDLQAQNMRLLEELQVSTVQQAGGAVGATASASASSSQREERKCPICMQPFEDQADLIQHAGICDNELASMF